MHRSQSQSSACCFDTCFLLLLFFFIYFRKSVWFEATCLLMLPPPLAPTATATNYNNNKQTIVVVWFLSLYIWSLFCFAFVFTAAAFFFWFCCASAAHMFVAGCWLLVACRLPSSICVGCWGLLSHSQLVCIQRADYCCCYYNTDFYLERWIFYGLIAM